MAHKEQMRFFSSVLKYFQTHFEGKVLDIGSLDIGGGPHLLFNAEEYIGVDLGPGSNVDLISGGQDVELQSNYFDVAMSSECFEHNPDWRSTFHNMVRMTKPGGIVVFSCAGIGRPEHGTSKSEGWAAPLAIQAGQEYYKNVRRREVQATIDEFAFSKLTFFENHVSCDLYFIGIKKPGALGDIQNLELMEVEYRKHLRSQGSWPMVITRLILRPFWIAVNRFPFLKWAVKGILRKEI
jgi:SAM-dependent methyltransferase